MSTKHSSWSWLTIWLFVAAFSVTGCSTTGPFASKKSERSESVARNKLKDPQKLDLLYGKWQEQVGNHSEARDRYQRVLSDEPQSVEALVGLARLDQLAGRTSEAEQGFRKALKSAPNNPQVLDALGQFYVSQEKWPQAVETLKHAQSTAPTDTSIRFHLAVALAKSGDLAAARPHFVQSVGDAEADYNLGLILHDQGKLEQAEQYFTQAVLKKPSLEEAQFWISEIRTEKQTKQVLTGATASHRPSFQAPAGAISTPTNLQPAQVYEERLSPNQVMGIQQTSAQIPGQRLSGIQAAATPPTGTAMPNPSTPNNGGGWASPFGMNRSNSKPSNQSPIVGNTPWQTLMNGQGNKNAPGSPTQSAASPQGLTQQQLEQMRNQR